MHGPVQIQLKRFLVGTLVVSFALVGSVPALADAPAAPAPDAGAAAVAAPLPESLPPLTEALSTAPTVLAQTFSQRIVSTAMTYRGIPYRFGAEGPRAYDCSGFTQSVFARNGVHLPRTAAQQSRVGTFVSKSQLQPGDLVFFKDTYKAGVSHVGIYIGGGKMVHAWPGAGVTIGDLNRPYFVRHYWGAKRIRG